MAAARKSAKPAGSGSGTQDVDGMLRQLAHPLKDGIEMLRAAILATSPRISEGIKWNSPSFRTTEWFATVNVRKDAVMLILHLGAKASAVGVATTRIEDPAKLLHWLGKDRAAMTFADLASIKASRGAVGQVVRQWIAFVD